MEEVQDMENFYGGKICFICAWALVTSNTAWDSLSYSPVSNLKYALISSDGC
jgi:hypothetical protein